MNPGYQDPWSQISNNRGSNQYFTEPSSPSYYAKPYYQDFVPMYFKSVPSWYQKTNKGSLNQNNMYNFEQNPYKTLFQTPKRPNTESSFNQNPYQGTFDQSKGFSIPTPPYKYNPEADPNSKPLAELHGIPFTISVLPSQKAVSLDSTNSESHPSVPYHEPAGNDQNLFQQDRNQFFHPPQQNIYPKPPSESIHPPEIPSRGDTGQPGGDPSKTEEKLGSVYRKVGDLKAQIYSLQNVIDDLNKHNYTQTPQDKGKRTNNLEGKYKLILFIF